ncbi:hydroxypyruvate isomerase family protein [Afifella sp. IM 167]|uniref:hydroxypyruvate isomerase family protein n=1 Tax=Afifella sp. IM 167 TaxID=2033586 RepID=UPI001CCB92D7|nr:TIM barrel protein [Afifella sp. IM 167]MBZ8134980.1 isomerase [Afifella sp. IM 167]
MLKFSANLGLLWAELPLPERIRAAKEAGFDAVELHFPYEESREALKAALAETGLPLLGINTRPGRAGEFGLSALPGRGAEARAAIDEAVEWAADLGGRAVHVMAGVPSHEMPVRRCREAFARLLAYAAGRCGEKGLTAVIEPINTRDVPGYFLSTSAIAERFLDMVASEHLKMQFDCYHAQIMEGDVTRRIERLMPKIGHIQVAAVPSRAEPDEGELSYERLLPAIEAAGYKGYIGAEYRPRGKVEAGLSWLAAYRASCR